MESVRSVTVRHDNSLRLHARCSKCVDVFQQKSNKKRNKTGLTQLYITFAHCSYYVSRNHNCHHFWSTATHHWAHCSMAAVTNASNTPYVAFSANSRLLLIKSWQKFALRIDDTQSKQSHEHSHFYRKVHLRLRLGSYIARYSATMEAFAKNGGSRRPFLMAMQLPGSGSARSNSSWEARA